MLAGRPFSETFAFVRSDPDYVRDATGRQRISPPNTPRFDHTPDGEPLGLLVQTGVRLGAGDSALVNAADDWHRARDHDGRMTIVHAFEPEARNGVTGALERRAWYSTDPVATVNACLAQAGHHRFIAAYEGYLPNRDGYVLVRGLRWKTACLVADLVADDSGRPLVGT